MVEAAESTILEGEGNGDASAGADAGKEAAAGEINWRDGLSEDYKEKFPELKDVTSIFKSYDNLVTKMGQNPIVKPKDDATDEAKAEYLNSLRKELGAPENVDAYEFKLAEDLPEGFADEKLLGDMKEVFLEAGIAPESAQKIIDTYFEKQLTAFNEGQAQVTQANETAVQELKDAWKGEYDGNLNKAMAFAERNYSKEVIDKFGNDPDFIKNTLELHNKTSGDRIDNISGQVKQTPSDLRAEAVTLMKSDDYQNPMSPSHNTIKEKVRGLYKLADEQETK